jgi:hypothetical protein
MGEAVERYSEALEVIGERASEGGGGQLRAILLSNRATAQFKVCSCHLLLSLFDLIGACS